MDVKIPDKLAKAFAEPPGTYRYRCFAGGRGSGKSRTAAIMALIWGLMRPIRVLCCRQYQSSISESFYVELLTALSDYPELKQFYSVKKSYILGLNGTYFFFKGLQRDIYGIKSISNIDLCIVEEAEDIPEESWVALEPTVRNEKSEFWVIWNPRIEGSAVDKRFIKVHNPLALLTFVNYDSNPFFPSVLEQKRAFDAKVLDEGTYRHIWLGEYLRNSASQILNGKCEVGTLAPSLLKNADGPYHGMDFGFAEDPSAVVRCYITQDREILYIERELYGKHVELDNMPRFLIEISDIQKYKILADSSRPETISHIKRRGFRIEAAPKWQGSIEDGIAFLRGFRKILIHPSCKNTITESRLYSYKVDRITGDILPDPVDRYNHCIDALRYALAPMIQRRSKNWLDF